jgi:hypothetical protein
MVCNSNIFISSPPSEPAELSIMDKVVDQLLNEAAEVVLRED